MLYFLEFQLLIMSIAINNSVFKWLCNLHIKSHDINQCGKRLNSIERHLPVYHSLAGADVGSEKEGVWGVRGTFKIIWHENVREEGCAPRLICVIKLFRHTHLNAVWYTSYLFDYLIHGKRIIIWTCWTLVCYQVTSICIIVNYTNGTSKNLIKFLVQANEHFFSWLVCAMTLYVVMITYTPGTWVYIS